ncbi:MAG: NADH-quinone oxidoreductase subunit L [Betaproteobacteria bacterium]|nr:NADH-quinone oxidoreductase subunit L [Betaproteobacteria bacterium]
MLAAVLLIPLLGSVLNGFFLRKAPRLVTVTVATLAIALPFVLSCALVFGPIASGEVIRTELFKWISVPLEGGWLEIPFALSLDRLSGILLLIITGVGSLIHLYAGEYMHHEEGVYRFFAYLNLFVFSMLSLVLGANMVVTFLGWEGVGVCSYLLIGYWYSDEANARAGMKAFVANRVGDLGFLLAMFMSVKLFGSVDYSAIAASLTNELASENASMITAIGLCMLLGVAGKSAQLPLYIWLPDAMAGPTPVSALIHAATMVTSGIYLMTRMSFLLVHSSTAMTTIAVIGAATALFAATIGLVQNDIKKVLAYSTVSQLGFMALGCGVGAFQYGVAHLMTHAFFKALLFLGAGSVIHAMHHEQDIRKMGGLIKKMPITGWTFVIGTLAIIGFPGFSGFFSKDEILYYAWSGTFGHPLLWVTGALAAACTSFYMVRLTYLVFFGQSRVEHAHHHGHGHDDHHHSHEIHENPWTMTLPLVLLAVFSIVGGYVSIPHAIMHVLGLEGDNAITQWLYPVISSAKEVMKAVHGDAHGSAALEWGLMGTSTLVMLIMSGFAIALYKVGPQGGDAYAQAAGGLYRLILDKWRIDELYQAVIIEPLKKVGDGFFKFGDRAVIEGVINEGPRGIYLVTSVLSDIQSGLVRNYLKLVFVAVVALGAWIFI